MMFAKDFYEKYKHKKVLRCDGTIGIIVGYNVVNTIMKVTNRET